MEVTDDIRDGDTRIVEAAYNQLIKWIVGLNFGDVVPPKFVLFENEESGTKERAERDKLMTDAGAKFSNQYWQRTYGLEDGDLLEEAQTSPETKAIDFAETQTVDIGVNQYTGEERHAQRTGIRINGKFVAPNAGFNTNQGKAMLSRMASVAVDKAQAAHPDIARVALRQMMGNERFKSSLNAAQLSWVLQLLRG